MHYVNMPFFFNIVLRLNEEVLMSFDTELINYEIETNETHYDGKVYFFQPDARNQKAEEHVFHGLLIATDWSSSGTPVQFSLSMEDGDLLRIEPERRKRFFKSMMNREVLIIGNRIEEDGLFCKEIELVDTEYLIH